MAILLFSFVRTFAQERCATDHWHEYLMQTNPEYREYFENENMALRADRDLTESNSSFTVPVMVWIFHNDGPENISRAQVLDALDVLNSDVQRLNADTANTSSTFKPVAGSANIEFKLATVGPTGECTDGIVRIKTPLTKDAPNEIKQVGAAANADNTKYLNIYVIRSIENFTGGNGTILGYAYFPNPGQQALLDGIVIRHDVMGRIGSATTGFGTTNGGRTLTHELGHYLGLAHTFQSGCFGNGDSFSDTPPVAASNSGCNWGNSCSNDSPDLPDQGENYMDYTKGVCQNMFSIQQAARMVSVLNGTRNGLVTSQNLNATGVSNPGPICSPNAYIGAQDPYVCLNDSIDLYDYSWNAPVTTRQWSILNSSLTIAADSAVRLGFSSPGMYTVQMNASNGQGSSMSSRVINVFDTVGFVPGFYTESFEAPFQFGSQYQIQPNQPSLSWATKSGVARTGNQCMYIPNIAKTTGSKEEFILPPLNLAQQGASILEFSYAFAKRSFDDDDELRIWVSLNCGTTWIPRKVLSADQLVTASQQGNSEFIPTRFQWQTDQLSLAAYQSIDLLLVKFEFTSGGGNNFYLDALLIQDPLSPEELEAMEVSIYPNPTGRLFQVELEAGMEADIEVRDLTGRLVHVGRYSGTAEINSSNWSAGTYVVLIRSQSETLTRKLIKK